jgi:L-glyceraldehyde 3-phosphate reductase
MTYQPDPARYGTMTYNRCGRSGVKLSALSLGLWHNFGGVDPHENGRAMVRKAFDLGITHFDLANNYGPPPGSAESCFGRILKQDFGPGLRDELVISTKAGWKMWEGPYGDWGSRKYLFSSLDQSLQRLGLDYVDIFYHHRPDPETPLEETMAALDHVVRSGKALYAGISSYKANDARRAAVLLRGLGTPCLIHQPSYSIFNRWVEPALLDVCDQEGIGVIGFCPLAQGLLTNRYLGGIPDGSRASRPNTFLKKQNITDDVLAKVRKLDAIAKTRGQSLAQMALCWVLRRKTVTSALIGASSPEQIEENVQALKAPPLTEAELKAIDQACA